MSSRRFMFAVVVFTEESDDTCKSVQEVPVSWLSEDARFCRWPPKNSCIYTAKNVPPQDDWPWHPVEVERYCDTLKEAKMRSTKEVSTDDEQLGKGFRAVKPKNYFSPDISIPKKRLPRADAQYEFPPALEVTSVPLNNKSVSTEVSTLGKGCTDYFDNTVYTLQILDNPVSNSDDHTITEIGNIESDHSEVCSGTNEASAGSFPASIDEKFDKIIEILSSHKLILDELLERNHKKTFSLPLVKFDLPLKTLEDINTLDGKLQDKNVLAKFIRDLEAIGGNGPKDFISRIMKAIFTNQLGELCSWTGAKNNFRISNLKLISAIYSIVHKKYEIAQGEFEVNVKDWLKNAKQRRIRDESRDRNDMMPILLLPIE